LLHLINSSARGGRELYVRDLIIELQKSRVNNFVLCRKHSVVDEACKRVNIPVIYTKNNLKFSLFEVMKLVSFIKKHKISSVYSHTRNDVFTGSLIKLFIPVKHIHGIYMGTGPKKDFIHRFVYSRVDVLVTSSEFSKNECEKYLPVPEGTVKLIRYGRHLQNYAVQAGTRAKIRELLSTTPDKLVVAVMSRIDSGKGVGIFANALNYLSTEEKLKIEFWVMGEPTVESIDDTGKIIYEEQAQILYDQLKKLTIQEETMHCFKMIPFQKDYISYLSAMDIFVLPTHNEMYSLSVIDAMIMGLPVIGTDAGGTTEQIGDNERGMLVTPSSSEAIATAIRFFLNSPQEIHIRGNNAKLWASSQHDFTTQVMKYLEIASSK
jgi:glycosyltransferase involved in cell wall biosynthesis